MDIAQISTDGTHQIVILPEEFQLAGTSPDNFTIALLSVWLYETMLMTAST